MLPEELLPGMPPEGDWPMPPGGVPLGILPSPKPPGGVPKGLLPPKPSGGVPKGLLPLKPSGGVPLGIPLNPSGGVLLGISPLKPSGGVPKGLFPVDCSVVVCSVCSSPAVVLWAAVSAVCSLLPLQPRHRPNKTQSAVARQNQRV